MTDRTTRTRALNAAGPAIAAVAACGCWLVQSRFPAPFGPDPLLLAGPATLLGATALGGNDGAAGWVAAAVAGAVGLSAVVAWAVVRTVRLRAAERDALLAGLREQAAKLSELNASLSLQTLEIADQAHELERQRAWLEAVLDQLPAGVLLVDPDGRIVSRNRTLQDMLGFTGLPERSLGELKGWPVVSPDGSAVGYDDWPAVRALRDGAAVRGVEMRIARRGGGWADTAVSAAPIRGAGGEALGAVTVVFDTGPVRRAEDRLRLLESAVVHAHDAIVLLEPGDRPGRGRSVLYVNDAFCAMTGYARGEVVGRSLHFLRGPGTDPHTLDRLRAALAAGEPLQVELLNYRKDGSELWVDLSLVPVPDAAGAVTHWVMIQRDITDRRRAEAALRRSEERYRLLFESNPHPMWVYDRDTLRFLAVNAAAVHKYGYSRDEFLGLTIADIRPPEDVPRLREAVRRPGGGYEPPSEWRHRTKGGAELDVEISAFALQFDGRDAELVLANDVTDRKRLEDQLLQAQKMEALGQLAGGIAHDFNNLLTAVLGNLALVEVAADDPNRPLLSAAERAAGRAADLTRKLLGYARRNQVLLAPVRADAVVHEVVDILRRTLDPRIEIAVAADAGPVRADATLLNQALFNLCLNARDAMPAGGRLSITVEDVVLTAADAAGHPDARPGAFVRVSVADTGSGIPDDLRPRIFEPFFTTKGVGRGTGLGLPMVHGIMKQHTGWVACDSRVGRGTRFDLYLPAAGSHDAPAPVRRTPTEPAVAPPADTPTPGRPARPPRTVLLVDDEEMIRMLARAVLERAGFKVIEAEDGLAAVELYRHGFAAIDLVILDLTMPRMSGRDAFREMTAVNPDARILFSSGYSADDVSEIDGALGLLSKPYRPDDLVAAVRDALAHEPAGVG